MKITTNNMDCFTESVYLHDAVIEDFQFNYKTHQLKIAFYNHYTQQTNILDFQNIADFSCRQDSPWGENDEISEVTVESETIKTFLVGTENSISRLIDFAGSAFLRVLLLFCSGDKMQVVCQSIEIEGNLYDGEDRGMVRNH